MGRHLKEMKKHMGWVKKNKTLIGKQFIVIYALGDESNNDLNINFAIESEQDFEDFKSKFSSGPPAPDFPNNCR